jgi:ribosomal protein S18 acetylase RimI-like enzyme
MAELRAIVRPMVDAFWDYPETVHLLPDEGRRRRVLPRYLLSDARDADGFGTLLVDPGGAGAAAWIPPAAYPVGVGRQLRQVADLLPALPWAWRCAAEARRAQTANRIEHRRHPPHYYLRAIGVSPAAQGRGVGSALVAPMLERADAEGVGCFLQTATEANVAWYGRFGFEVVASYRPTPTWPMTFALWRPPPQK